MENVENERSTKYVVVDEPPMNAEEHVAVRLKALRQAKGLTQAQLAQRLEDHGMSWHQTTVAKTERADRPLRLNEVEALAKALGVPLTALLTDRAPVALEGEAARAAMNLDTVERLHSDLHAILLDAARAYGKALGEADALKTFMDKQQARLDELSRDLLDARDLYLRALDPGVDRG